MAQEDASTNHEPTVGLLVDLQRARSEAEREETTARAGEDIHYWRGRRNGLELAMMKLSDSGWRPPESDSHPDGELKFVLSIDVSISRRTGEVSSFFGGPWEENEECENVLDAIHEAGREIVSLNPEDYVTDPPPRTVRLHQETVPVIDTWAEPLMLSKSEAAGARYLYDDGRFVFLTLLDGQTVRVEKVDVEVEQFEP